MWRLYNPNPEGRQTIDCTVRALTKALGVSWDEAYILVASEGFRMKSMPVNNAVWGAVLKDHGFLREGIPNTCPACYTAEEFADDHPRGTYVLAFDGHVATVQDGVIFDSWDSSREVPQFYWTKGEGNV